MAVAALAAVLAVTTLAGMRRGDPALYPAEPGTGVPVFVVSNGYHPGLVLPRPERLGLGSERAALPVSAGTH